MMEFLAEGKKAKPAKAPAKKSGKAGGSTKGKKIKSGGETEYAYKLKSEPKGKDYGVHKGDFVVWRKGAQGVFPIKK